MARNPRYDVLFEPVKLGPVTAPNRFYQVPHASGMTNALPRVRAAFREVKAEGGWGVVCTGACSIHPSSDDSPLPFARLWDDDDVRSHVLMTEAVHRHGALAGVELWHGGAAVMNRTSRLPQLSPSGTPWMPTHVGFMSNRRPKVMDADDIKELLRWQAEGARKARSAGFDVVYVYAGMGYLPHQFLLSDYNRRDDAYGGSVENRVRLVRELLEVTKEAVGDTCAVALRISLEELRRKPGTHAESEAHEVVALLAELPDLWDVKMDSTPSDCGASRFSPEGSHEPVIDFVKTLTSKPVVGVGRFTSPDAMVSQVRRGVLDLIGAARPSIADPFLPRKIDEGREDEIRECIGCNICISSWYDGVPVRCTQNPTVGEEWRRGWHPERIPARGSDDRVLIVGGGPSGLECARALAQRGYEVTLADTRSELGGRLIFETALPGLSAWRRVLDYRLGQLRTAPNASLYPESLLSVNEVLEFGVERVVLATGSRWTTELYSTLEMPAGRLEGPGVYTPDDIAAGAQLEGPIVVFDFDSYTMGGCLTELLAERHGDTSYVTPAGHASDWTILSNELPLVHQALARRGVTIHTLKRVTGFDGARLQLADLFTGETSELPCRALVIVGMRRAEDALFRALAARPDDLRHAGIRSLERIGDALSPGAIVHAVHSGHGYARVLDSDAAEQSYRLDSPIVSAVPEPAFTARLGRPRAALLQGAAGFRTI
ncbi:MAG: FAD-dependent oxidoreductase [Kiloniellales bacterium]